MQIGQWKLWSDAQYSVVLDVLEHVAFAYLLDDEGHILSHVWLTNFDSAAPIGEDDPPQMPESNIFPSAETLPESVTLISTSYVESRCVWVIRWGQRSIAELGLDDPVGKSSSVVDGSTLAGKLG